MEKFAVTRLIGAPPGYIGYEEGGQLTEKVRRKPYSIILLDELEKAHPDVFNILLQVLDDGKLTDGKGRVVDFKNTIIIATSNIGSDMILATIGAGEISKALDAMRPKESEKSLVKLKSAVDIVPSWEDLKNNVFELLKKFFRPEFLNRLDEIVLFKPLSDKEIEQVVSIILESTKHLMSSQNIDITFDKNVIKEIAKQSYNPQFGARPIKRTVQREIDNLLSNELLNDKISSGDKIRLSFKMNKFVVEKIN